MKLIQPDLPAGYLSFSQIDTYLTCPKRYEWRYIIKPEMIHVGSPAMTLGSSLHELIAIVLTSKMKGVKYNASKLLTESRERLHDKLDEINDASEQLELQTIDESTREMIINQHDGLFTTWQKDILPELAPTDVEKKIDITIGGYPFLIYIDAIHAKKRIVDWKVTASPKNKAQVDNSLQLSVYSIGAGIDEVAFGSLIRPKEGNERTWKPKVSLIVSTRTKADHLWATEVVKTTAESIRARVFPFCTPENFLCSIKYCDFYPICRGKNKNTAPTWMKAFV